MTAAQAQTTLPSPVETGLQSPARSGLVPYRLTVNQFHKMIEAGILGDEDRVELLAGLLIKKMTKYDPHDFAVDELGDRLGRILPADWIARQEKSVVLGRFWRPEPDITVAHGPRNRYRSKAPGIKDLWLLAEVSESSYDKDRGLKWRSYAECKVAIYWIVNIAERRIEVYTAPSGKGKAAKYAERKDYGPEDEVPVIIEGQEVGRIKVSEIL